MGEDSNHFYEFGRFRLNSRDRALLRDQEIVPLTPKVFDMLLALPRHGRVKATKILQSCRVSPSATFGGLSERQRTELAGRFDR